jgi:hypothetical protein
MKKFLLTVFFSFLTLAAFAQTGSLVREDRIWNYRYVYSRIGYSEEYDDPGYHFEGTEERDGETYCVFRNGEGEKVALMRQEGGKVWRYFDNDEENYYINTKKVLLYNFDIEDKTIETWSGYSIAEFWVDSYDDGTEYCYNFLQPVSVAMKSKDTVIKNETTFNYLKLGCDAWYRLDPDDELFWQEVEWFPDYVLVEGVGMNSSKVHAPGDVFDMPTGGSVLMCDLVSMTDLEGNVLFEEKDFERILSSVRGVEIEETNSPARFYDINGVEVSGDAKGLVIERKGDGSTVKRLNR